MSTVRIVGSCTAIAALLCVTACGSSADDSGSEDTSTVRIGLIASLTGPLAGPATELVNGVHVAVNAWNATERSKEISLEVCDDGGQPAQAQTCIQSLRTKVDVFVGPIFSSLWASTLETYKALKLFAIAPAPASEAPPDTDIFTTGTPADVALDRTFSYFKDQGWTDVGFISTNDDASAAAAQQAPTIAEKYDLTLTQATFEATARTAVPQLNTIKAANPQVVQVWSVGQSAVTVIRGMNETGMSMPIVMNYSNATAATFKIVGDDVPPQLHFIGSPNMVSSDAQAAGGVVAAYDKLYSEKYGPASWNAMAGGDAILVAMSAAANGVGPEDMRQELEKGDPITGLTMTFTFSKDSHAGANDPEQLAIANFADGSWSSLD